VAALLGSSSFMPCQFCIVRIDQFLLYGGTSILYFYIPCDSISMEKNEDERKFCRSLVKSGSCSRRIKYSTWTACRK